MGCCFPCFAANEYTPIQDEPEAEPLTADTPVLTPAKANGEATFLNVPDIKLEENVKEKVDLNSIVFKGSVGMILPCRINLNCH